MEFHNQEEWELVNEDGFVYKRPKRIHPYPTSTTTPPDPAAEERTCIEKKKTLLKKLKTKHQDEIFHWELLSNTLRALKEPPKTRPLPALLPDLTITQSSDNSLDSTYREVAERLLNQVEAQEVTINEVSRLCDVAESFCDVQEKLLNQPFIYLPVWESSPQKLITSLCDE